MTKMPNAETALPIQDMRLEDERAKQQFLDGRLSSSLYFGESITATEWAKWHQLHPMRDTKSFPLDDDVEGNLCVVDLGPGSGDPCVAAIEKHRDRIKRIVVVDTNIEMGNAAAARIQSETKEILEHPVLNVPADFFRDQEELRAQHLNRIKRAKIFLLLGGTMGNYEQEWAIQNLRKLMNRDYDRIVIGLGYLAKSEKDAHAQMEDLGEKFCSPENCRFALSFLNQCGANLTSEDTFFKVGWDGQERGIKVVRGKVRFPRNTILRINRDPDNPLEHKFDAGDILEFTQSRRYPAKAIPPLLEEYGLEVIMRQNAKSKDHGVFLCKKIENGQT